MSDFQQRLLGAARLDPAIYEEVEQDDHALGQALVVVLLSAAAAALGDLGRVHLGGIVLTLLAALVGWAVWALLTFVIATRFLPEAQTSADPGRLLRTLGFAAAPGLLQVFAIVGGLRPLVFAAVQFWMMAAMVVAVRQAFDYTSTGRAVAVCAIGWVTQLVVVGALLALVVRAPQLSVARPRGDVREPPAASAVGVIKPSGVTPPVR